MTGIGIVETKYFDFNELVFDSGEKIGSVTIAYETYGKLNEGKNNAILLCHALTGDAHAAGYHAGVEKPGWWDDMVGPGKAFDTDKYFVISSNVIGGCKGSTGPSSINPATKKPYGLTFPVLTIKDMVNAQKKLIDQLGIAKLFTVAGGSMGGMQVLQWGASYPEKVRSLIPIATAAKHSPQQIALSEVGRQAVMADPDWKEGDYYGKTVPAKGLAVARMVGHITYMSDASMLEKFGRQTKQAKQEFKFSPNFEVEGYLKYRGDSFVKRFDANSYLYITKSLDYFDLSFEKPLHEVFRNLKAKFLVMAFKSDWLYPAYQALEIVKACKLAGLDVTYCEIESTYGHDAFLLEVEEETHLIKHFLEKVLKGEKTEYGI
ncbi:MAG TPA: homoserine O-acetyltransferase [bacterium]|nr:homoserine O-acetyltransferase [bacterium]